MDRAAELLATLAASGGPVIQGPTGLNGPVRGNAATSQTISPFEPRKSSAPADAADAAEQQQHDGDADAPSARKARDDPLWEKYERSAGFTGHSSIAGACSKVFHRYRRLRERNIAREREMDGEHKKKLADERFEKEKREIDDQLKRQTAKKREQRLKRKRRKQLAKQKEKDARTSPGEPVAEPAPTEEAVTVPEVEMATDASA